MIHYSQHPSFVRQIEKIQKRFRSIDEDLVIAEKAAIELLHIYNIDNGSVKLIPKFDSNSLRLYKVKKFACKTLVGKGVRSGIRIIYAFYPLIMKIEYLEIYYKEKPDTDMDYNFAKLYFAKHRGDD